MSDPALRSRKLVVDGKAESLIVYFRDGARIKEGLKFVLGNMGRVVVYVGEDDLPVALQFVDPLPNVAPAGRSVPDEEEDTASRQALYGLSCKMIAFKRADRGHLGASLIPNAVESVGRLIHDPTAA